MHAISRARLERQERRDDLELDGEETETEAEDDDNDDKNEGPTEAEIQAELERLGNVVEDAKEHVRQYQVQREESQHLIACARLDIIKRNRRV